MPGGLPGLDPDRLRDALAGTWDVRGVLARTGSTNDDAAAAAGLGSGEPSGPARGPVASGVVVVADHQTRGRGRNGRPWRAAPREAVAVSVVLIPVVATSRWGWIPLLAGQAVRDSVAALLDPAGRPLPARIKWPNDVLLSASSPGKVSGVLAEVRGPAVVVGAGINTNAAEADPPFPGATSLRAATGGIVDPTGVVVDYLDRLRRWFHAWRDADGDAQACGLREAHLAASATLGRRVEVRTPAGSVRGVAADVDPAGCLVVTTPGQGVVSLSAGDVVHVR